MVPWPERSVAPPGSRSPSQGRRGYGQAAAARLRNEGIDPGPLLEEAGLAPGQDSDVGAWIDAGQQVRFLNLAADALPDTMLGFHLAWDFEFARLRCSTSCSPRRPRSGRHSPGFRGTARWPTKASRCRPFREWDRAPFRKFRRAKARGPASDGILDDGPRADLQAPERRISDPSGSP